MLFMNKIKKYDKNTIISVYNLHRKYILLNLIWQLYTPISWQHYLLPSLRFIALSGLVLGARSRCFGFYYF